MNSFTDTHTQKVNRGNMDFFYSISQPKSDSTEKDKMQEAVAQVSVELSQETQGTCSHLTRAQSRLRVQFHLYPDLNRAASLHPHREVSVTERPPHPSCRNCCYNCCWFPWCGCSSNYDRLNVTLPRTTDKRNDVRSS